MIEIKDIIKADEYAIIRFLNEKCPAVDVCEVVRCKDCTHIRDSFDQDEHDCIFYCEITNQIIYPSHYCSYGAKRGDEK